MRGEGDTGKGGQEREGKGEVSEGKRARADEGAQARAMVYMGDDNASNKSGRRTTARRGSVALK